MCRNVASAISGQAVLELSRGDPDHPQVVGALEANGGEPLRARRWRNARAATHTMVELELARRPRLVVIERHGESPPAVTVCYSLSRAAKLR
jgi:hypothetical protein